MLTQHRRCGIKMTISVEREGNEAKLIERDYHTWSVTIPSGTLQYVIDALQGILKDIETSPEGVKK